MKSSRRLPKHRAKAGYLDDKPDLAMTGKRAVIATVLILSAILALPLAAQMKMAGTAAAGRRLFYSSAISGNGLSCANCHADFDEERRDDGLIRSGHSLYNAAGRQTWWGKDPQKPDAYTSIAAAAVVCVEHFMRNPKKLTAQQMLDLQAYLKFITPYPTRAALAIAPAADKTGEYAGFAGGNRFGGKPLFFAACHICHPNGKAGIAPAIPRDRDPAFYARKIREGDGLGAVLSGIDPNAYDPASGGFMPFYGADRLTDRQIRDIIAFIKNPPPSP